MKRDFRTSEVPDLNENFRNYNSGTSLLAYYKFSQYDTTTNQVADFCKDTSIDPLTYESTVLSHAKLVESNPYQGRADLKSVSLRKAQKQCFRLPYVTLSERIASNQIPITIAGWAQMPDISGDGDANLGILTSIAAGTVFNTTNGNFKFVYAPATKKFEFGLVLTTSSAGVSTIIVPTVSIFDISKPVSSGDWFHFAIRVKSTIATTDATGADIGDIISIFINGENVTDAPSCTGGDSGGGTKFAGANSFILKSTDVIVGKGPSDTTAVAQFSTINFHELAFWTSALAEGEILSLYEAAKMFAGSGVLSLPPKVQIDNRENNTVVNPIVLANVDNLNNVTTASFFDDTTVRLFDSTSINYSAGIPRHSRLITASVASPSQEPDIYLNSGLRVPNSPYGCPSGSYVFGNATINTADSEALSVDSTYPGVGTQYTGDRPFTQQRYGKGYSWDIKESPAPFHPFNDTEVLDDRFSIWKEDSLIGPSFDVNRDSQHYLDYKLDLPTTSSRRGRSIIPITLKNSTILDATRYDVLNQQDPQGPTDASNTGFYYWNWKSKRWNQKGNTIEDGTTGVYHFRLLAERYYRWDWSTGSASVFGYGFFDCPSTPRKLVVSYSDGTSYLAGQTGGQQSYRKCSPAFAGFESIPRQFYPGPKETNGLFRTSSLILTASYPAFLTSSLYAGQPMMQYGAPQNTTYFAKEAERLKLSNYIQAPFILEKAILTLTVEGRRTYSNRDRFPANSYPQDDYVFFLYRQATVGNDIKQQLSSSDRYLICSGNVAVYAEDCWDSDSSGSIAGGGILGVKYSDKFGHLFKPVNSPAVSLKLLTEVTGGIFDPGSLKNSNRNRPYPASHTEDRAAFEVTTGQKSVEVVMTPALCPKRRYGQFWEHTQVQHVVSGNWYYLSAWGALSLRPPIAGVGTGGNLNIIGYVTREDVRYPPYTNQKNGAAVIGLPTQNKSFWSDDWEFMNREILYASACFSARNPDMDIMTPSTDISESLNYGYFGSTTEARSTDGKAAIINIASVPPDYNRGTPVFCSWLGGTTYVASPLNKEAIKPQFRGGYRIRSSSNDRRQWYGQRLPPKPKNFNISPEPETFMTPLGAVWETGSIWAQHRQNYGGEPWSSMPPVTPTTFLEINQINEEATKNFLAAEKLDPRTRNIGTRYSSYVQQGSASYFNITSSVNQITGSNPGWRQQLIWNGTRNVFDSPTQAGQRKTGYLLLPGDDLILGLDAALAAPKGQVSGSVTCLTGSYLRLSRREFKLTLVGSYVKDNRRIAISSDQQLLNANASLAIGTDRVTDQFLVGTRTDYQGSYLSKHMTGSMMRWISNKPLNPDLESDPLWTGRNLVDYVAPTAGDYRQFRRIFSSELSKSLGDTASFQRFTSCYDSGSVYYDSLVPLPQELYKPFDLTEFNEKGNYEGGTLPGSGDYGYRGPDGRIVTKNAVAGFGLSSRHDLKNLWNPDSVGQPNNAGNVVDAYNENWYRSFPYESKYTRKRKAADGSIVVVHPLRQPTPNMESKTAVLSSGSSTDINVRRLPLAKGRIFLAGDIGSSIDGNVGYAANNWRTWRKAGLLVAAPKILVGSVVPSWSTGAGGTNINPFFTAYAPEAQHSWFRSTDVGMHLRYQYGYVNCNDFFGLTTYSTSSGVPLRTSLEYATGLSYDRIGMTGEVGFYPMFVASRKPSGWKYGVMNPVPIGPSAKFRPDRFGQFRDMLEQRLDAVIYDTQTEVLVEDSYPVVSAFRDPAWANPTDWVPRAAEATRSSNLSIYSTSSLPYFDDPQGSVYPDGRNRSGPIDDEAEEYVVVVADE